MKKLFLLFLAIFILSCSNDDSSDNPVLKLPPATQTGANTFGCIIDGKYYFLVVAIQVKLILFLEQI